MENQEQVHKRRVRYSGTHPKTYKEKYKEHNPEKYADTIAKVIQKGSTPAGMHISIMVQEILDFLQIKPGDDRLGCYSWLWWAYEGDALEIRRKRTYLRVGCRPN